MRVLIHAQHLSGAGHFVRMYEVARALAAHHEVTLVDGGRPVPRGGSSGVALLPLPRLVRGSGRSRLAPRDPAESIVTTLGERQRVLMAHLAQNPPDIVLVEHYPFSKWELGAELDALISRARELRPDVKVVTSLRDLPGQTKHEGVLPDDYRRLVLERLRPFDLVLVHGEEALTPLGASVPFACEIPNPVVYTGLVGEPLRDDEAQRAHVAALTDGRPFVLVSGGGNGGSDLDRRVITAWRALAMADVRLVICGGLDSAGDDPHVDETGILRLGFRDNFLGWLAAASVSVSHAGYNTCTNLVATATRAVLVPRGDMSDQAPRAALFARLGLAQALPADADVGAIAGALRRALAAPRPTPTLGLDGAERARHALESLSHPLSRDP